MTHIIRETSVNYTCEFSLFCTKNFHLLIFWLWICVRGVLHFGVKPIFWQYFAHTLDRFWWGLGSLLDICSRFTAMQWNHSCLQTGVPSGNGLSTTLHTHLMVIKYVIPDKGRVLIVIFFCKMFSHPPLTKKKKKKTLLSLQENNSNFNPDYKLL